MVSKHIKATLIFIFVSSICYAQVDTVWTDKGEIVLGQIFEEHDDNGKITYKIKTPDKKERKIKASNTLAFYRVGSKEKYVRLSFSGNGTKWYETGLLFYAINGSKNYTFFREIYSESQGLKVLWTKYYQSGTYLAPVFGGLAGGVAGGLLFGLNAPGGEYKDGYFIQKEDKLVLFEESNSKKIFGSLSKECKEMEIKFNKSEYSSRDMMKFVRDFNKALAQEKCK
jgi:hypothetical protein